jgi:pimeloyl-ACP methyl ester carboxylesterase
MTVSQTASSTTLTTTAVSTFSQTVTQASTQVITQTTTATSTVSLAPLNFAFVAQPANVNATIPSGVKLRFLQFTDVDGVTFNGALWEPQATQATIAVVVVHGTGGNYTGPPRKMGQATYAGQVSFVSAGLAARGYAVLAANNRGSNNHLDDANDVPKDLGAAVGVLKGLGYTNVIMVGLSLGGQQVLQYAAVVRDPVVKGLVLASASNNKPAVAKEGDANCAAGAYPGCKADVGLYARMYNESKTLIAQGKPTAILTDRFIAWPWMGLNPPATFTVSAINFLSYWSPEGVVSNNLIRQVTVPIIMTRDQSDSLNRASDAAQLLGNATAPGSLVSSARFVLLSDSAAPSNLNHTFNVVMNGQVWLNTTATWVQGLSAGK